MSLLMLTLFVHLQTTQLALADEAHRRSNLRTADDTGQATTEYALVLLAAAMVALLVVAWAGTGGGAAKISRLFGRVIDAVTSRV